MGWLGHATHQKQLLGYCTPPRDSPEEMEFFLVGVIDGFDEHWSYLLAVCVGFLKDENFQTFEAYPFLI